MDQSWIVSKNAGHREATRKFGSAVDVFIIAGFPLPVVQHRALELH
jgi:hypothetical protein